MCKFCEILYFILKNYQNFESYQTMLTINFFLKIIIIYNFFLYVMYITPQLHEVKITNS
jgi:hypothetical protein